MNNLPFNDLLTLVAFMVSGLVARPLASFLNSIPWFTSLSTQKKLAIVVVLNGAIVVIGMSIQQYVPSDFIATLNPWFKSVVSAGWMAWTVYNNQDAYQILKKSGAAV